MRVTTGPLDEASRARLSTARLLAVQSAPYLAHALFRMVPVAAHGLGTFAVDRAWRLYLDPQALLDWPPDQAAGVLVHEAGHLIRDHAGRAGDLGPGVDHRRWNYATDAAINDDLVRGEISLPEGAVTPAGLGLPANGIEEAYYDALSGHPACSRPDPAQRTDQDATHGGHGGHGGQDNDSDSDAEADGDGGGCGSGAGDPAGGWELPTGPTGPEAVSPGQARVIRRQVAEQVRAAARTAAGSVPASLDRWADRELSPATVRWQQVFGSAVRRAIAWRTGARDYTWTRLPRRRLPGVLTPAMRSPKVTVATVLDTSASMSEASVTAALGEVDAIARTAGIDSGGLSVVSVDAAVASTSRVRRAGEVRVAGGGGTDMRVGIAAALALRPRPDVVVVLTDGYTPWPDRAPAARVVVGLIGPAAAPAGSVPGWATTVAIPTG